jgi:hypothetical protein
LKIPGEMEHKNDSNSLQGVIADENSTVYAKRLKKKAFSTNCRREKRKTELNFRFIKMKKPLE